MIHVAAVIVALVVILMAGWFALAFISHAFEDGPGCGCLAIVGIVVLGLIVVAIAF